MIADGPTILGVIPARGGSKGLPGKNTRHLCGLPLIAHSIRAARMTQSISRCIVSTDSEAIAHEATSHGGDVPFLRPPELAADTTPMAPVIRHALEWVEREEGRSYDAVVLLDPTSPIRVPEQISSAASRLIDHPTLDGVVSVSEPTFNPIWVGVKSVGGANDPLKRFFSSGEAVTRRQDTDRFLRINGNFYVWRADFVRRLRTSWLDEGQHAGYEIPEAQSFSIDSEYEFRLIEALIAAGIVVLPGSVEPETMEGVRDEGGL